MDPKMIEMNNLRVLNDYLNQTIDALSRQPRLGHAGQIGLGYSPFGGIPTAAHSLGTDTVYGSWFGAPVYSPAVFGAQPFTTPAAPFAGLPVYGQSSYGSADPFFAQRAIGASFGGWQQPWSPASELARQTQLNQALYARQSVLETMCRSCGIPV